MHSTTFRSCRNLKSVVLVGPASTKQLKQALQRVSHQEKSAPEFVLSDMNSFMRAQRGLLLCIARDDDVAERDRRERQAGYCFAKHWAAGYKTNFHHAADACDFCPYNSA